MFTRTFALTAAVALAGVAADLSFVTSVWGADFEVGDKIIVESDSPLMDGETRLATVEMNTILTVEKVQGPWLLVVLERDRAKLKGYIQASKVIHLEAYVDGLSEMLRVAPENGQIYCNRAIGYRHLGATDKAAVDMREAVRLGVREDWLHAALGDFYYAQSEYPQAVHEYTVALGLGSLDANVYANRGCAHHQMGEHDQALADYSHAILLDRTSTCAYRRLSRQQDGRDGLAEWNRAVAGIRYLEDPADLPHTDATGQGRCSQPRRKTAGGRFRRWYGRRVGFGDGGTSVCAPWAHGCHLRGGLQPGRPSLVDRFL